MFFIKEELKTYELYDLAIQTKNQKCLCVNPCMFNYTPNDDCYYLK
jgi:hypothetical protein